ncbi:hypothetical protein ABIE52_006909 [Rhodococcus sp. OAS809]|uniref:hypothetical protein n=1 Tax=Rhodococcus sp. OAS809 TaxID=2663874 RepID=UPI00178BFCAF
MSGTAEPGEGQGWSPAPDVGQAGAVILKSGRWAYRYKKGVVPIFMRMPERPDPA